MTVKEAIKGLKIMLGQDVATQEVEIAAQFEEQGVEKPEETITERREFKTIEEAGKYLGNKVISNQFVKYINIKMI